MVGNTPSVTRLTQTQPAVAGGQTRKEDLVTHGWEFAKDSSLVVVVWDITHVSRDSNRPGKHPGGVGASNRERLIHNKYSSSETASLPKRRSQPASPATKSHRPLCFSRLSSLCKRDQRQRIATVPLAAMIAAPVPNVRESLTAAARTGRGCLVCSPRDARCEGGMGEEGARHTRGSANKKIFGSFFLTDRQIHDLYYVLLYGVAGLLPSTRIALVRLPLCDTLSSDPSGA